MLPTLRAYMKISGPLPGFHYLYIYEMILPLTVLHLTIHGGRKSKYLIFFAFIATTLLLFTAAKVNIIKAIIWSIFAYSFVKLEKEYLIKIISIGLIMLTIIITGFIFYTSFTGEIKSRPDQWYNIYSRFSAQLPTLDKLLNDSNVVLQYGKLSFLPLVKIYSIFFPETIVPSHILDFYDVPIEFNVATYLDVMYKDFGVLGIVTIPFFFGVFCGFCYKNYQNKKHSFWALYLLVIASLWVWASSSTAGFIKPVYWFQLAAGLLINYYIKKRDLPNEQKR
jgi:oligosaccharide repeat unit polymerase